MAVSFRSCSCIFRIQQFINLFFFLSSREEMLLLEIKKYSFNFTYRWCLGVGMNIAYRAKGFIRPNNSVRMPGCRRQCTQTGPGQNGALWLRLVLWTIVMGCDLLRFNPLTLWMRQKRVLFGVVFGAGFFSVRLSLWCVVCRWDCTRAIFESAVKASDWIDG